MHADVTPLIVGLLIFVSSLISLRLGISVAIFEIILGVIAGNSGLKTEAWMMYLANFGGIVLTFMAGTEIDTRLLKEKFKESFLIGFFSFLAPFVGVFLFTRYLAGWSYKAALIAGTAMSETSLAVVYSVLVETDMSKTKIGKLIMAATFITNMGTAIALSILFIKPTLYTAVFMIISVGIIFLASKYTFMIFYHPLLKNRVIEPEIKYIFLMLLVFMYFANVGGGQAILPAFLLGLFMSKYFKESRSTKIVKIRLRTVSYAIITPMFFIAGGMKVSLKIIIAGFGLFIILFALKQITKFLGIYFFAKKYIPEGNFYLTLLLSTGLTFGLIAILFGLNAGYISSEQYSILTGVLIASAVIPTFIAQKWFMPVDEEDIIEENGP